MDPIGLIPNEALTPEQVQEDVDVESSEYLQTLASLQGSRSPQNMFSFLGEKVLDAVSNIKSGNLTEDQIGHSKITSIGHQGIMNFCNIIKDEDNPNDLYNLLARFHGRELQSMHASSLSKEAKLLEVAMTTKKMERIVGTRRKKSGWFSKKQVTEDFPMSELQT